MSNTNLPPSFKQLRYLRTLANRRVPGNRAFDQGQFTAPETGAFARRVMIGTAAGLPGIDRQRLVIECVAQGLAELGVGDQAETAGQTIAGQLDDFSLLLQAHAFQAIRAQGGEYMAVGSIVVVEQAERLQQFVRPARQLRGESGDGVAARLLGDTQHPGAVVDRKSVV